MPPIPLFPEFRKITVDNKPLFDAYFTKHPSQTSEMTFTNFFIWRNCDRSTITIVNGNICVLASPENESPYWFEILGANRIAETIDICFSRVKRFSRISADFMKKHFEGRSGVKIRPDRDNSDYLYLRRDMAELKGKKYDGKRNRIKKFLKNHQPEYRELGGSDIRDCLELLERWKAGFKKGACIDEPIREALKNFGVLGLKGAVVSVNGRVEGFTIGEKLDPDTAIIYIEVTNQSMEGIAQYVNQQFSEKAWADVKYVNREQDLGDAGLRKAKLSYHPVRLIEKYDIVLEGE